MYTITYDMISAEQVRESQLEGQVYVRPIFALYTILRSFLSLNLFHLMYFIKLNKLVATTLESKFQIFHLRTQHPTKGFASLYCLAGFHNWPIIAFVNPQHD